MGWGRSNEEGFRGQYPAPLDWDAIEQELLAKAAGDSEPPQRGRDTPGRPVSDEQD